MSKIMTATIRVPRGGDMRVHGTRKHLLDLRHNLWRAGNKWVEIHLPNEMHPVRISTGKVWAPSKYRARP